MRRTFERARRAGHACVLWALVVGCSRDSAPEPPPPPPAPAAPGDPRGEWTIVAHRIPAMSAMTEADAAPWHGRVLRYGADAAIWESDSCRAPSFRSYTVATDSFLAIGFRVNSVDLGVDSKALPQLRLTEVLCAGEEWTAPGGLLLWTGPDRAYTPWDGVFFELERRPGGTARR